MRKRICVLMTVVLAAGIWGMESKADVVFAEGEPQITATAAVLIDGTTGKVLYDKNMHEQRAPASTTKIMTAILTLENLKMDQVLTADKEAADTEASKIAMQVGEEFTVEQLINVLLIKSANDAAVVLAKGMSDSTADFAVKMNERAKELGALNTNFVNPHGLTEPNHLTTAYDLAMMAQYAMKNPTFRKIVMTQKYTIPATNKQEEPRVAMNTNELTYNVKSYWIDGKNVSTKYEDATGIKTGFTQQAGKCFVASAMRDGRELICVVLQSDTENSAFDAIKLLDYGFATYENYLVQEALDQAASGEVRVKSGKAQKVGGYLEEQPIITIGRNSLKDIRVVAESNWADVLYAPVAKGTQIGTCYIYIGDVMHRQIAILADEDVDISSWVSPFSALKGLSGKVIIPLLILLFIFLILAVLYIILAMRYSSGRRHSGKRRKKVKPIFRKRRFR